MKKIILTTAALLFAAIILIPMCRAQDARVMTGLEVLRENGFAELKGKRAGLITNPTGVDHELRSGVDILFMAPGVRLAALYGPEHGVRGEYSAGAVSYTHLRAHETPEHLVCRLMLEKKKTNN